MFSRLMQGIVGADLTTGSGRAIVEERYCSLRRQVPVVYLLGLVNLSALELAATGRLSVGLNLPTFIAVCGIIRIWQWFGKGSARPASHQLMVRRMEQTVWFASAVCIAVCARCIYLLGVGDAASHMAVILFGGLTAIGVAYGLTALPAAARIPLLLIIGPISGAALLSKEPHFAGAAFGLVTVAALTMRLLGVHSRHFTDVIQSRSAIVREQERVERARQEALVAATTDFLTGLPNRRAFVAALEDATCGKVSSGAVAILDLDRFKGINDTFGHAIGDELLQEVARRLLKAVGEQGVVARLGGDEFGLLLPRISRAREAEAIGTEILRQVNGATFLGGREFEISASCGMALLRRRQDQSPSRIMADADLALYQAKANASGGLAMFELRMEAPRRRRSQIEQALKVPNVHEQMRVVFQPIFDLKSGSILANEALARWTDPQLGEVSPSEFVPLAEQLNLIDAINHHLMSLAFETALSWSKDIKLSFNLSAIQLCSPSSAKVILETLNAAGLCPGRVQVEVTETALLADFARGRENLSRLKKAGATIVLDDFGAGFSSVGYLRELQFDQIKLDGGLVTAAQHSADGKRLLRAVVALCETLGVATVAEHVESAELLRLVNELGCTAGQGFWLAAPLSSAQLEARLNGVSVPDQSPRRAA